jgi:hypothetical protein
MDTLVQPEAQSQVFFFISSIGFVILWIAVVITLLYLIRAINIFSRILTKLEKDIENIGDTTEELLEDMRDSAIFRFFFRGKKKRKEKK